MYQPDNELLDTTVVDMMHIKGMSLSQAKHIVIADLVAAGYALTSTSADNAIYDRQVESGDWEEVEIFSGARYHANGIFVSDYHFATRWERIVDRVTTLGNRRGSSAVATNPVAFLGE